jgi:GPH family glycoside/pentoside/hexuronide:cation symporter
MLFVCMWAMVADTVEYAQWRGAQRAEGAVYGFYNLVTKLAMAAAGGLAGLLLELHDYRPGEVSARALMGIERGMTLIPASCFALGLLAISFYALDESRYRQLLGQLLQRDPGR